MIMKTMHIASGLEIIVTDKKTTYKDVNYVWCIFVDDGTEGWVKEDDIEYCST